MDLAVAARLVESAKAVPGLPMVERFAFALQQLPLYLAQNAGMDGPATLQRLLRLHAVPPVADVCDGAQGEASHGYCRCGVDPFARCVRAMDGAQDAVIEPAYSKSLQYAMAIEAAISILRIDDILICQRSA